MGTDQSHRLMVGENLVELEFMVDYLAMSPMEALVASTTRAAECIERPDLGALALGKAADVLVVDGDRWPTSASCSRATTSTWS